MAFENQLQDLQNIHFLSTSETIDDIREDLHFTKLWADSFWRRRKQHSNRPDPEVSILNNLEFQEHTAPNVLEIGFAYGRFAKKALEVLPSTTQYYGLEVCKHFAPYYNQYWSSAALSEIQLLMVLDNFFKPATSLLPLSFDLIILPMNTFPTFLHSALSRFMNRLSEMLSEKGSFIFSTHKPPKDLESRSLEDLQQKFQGDRGGSVHVDVEDRIYLEWYPFTFARRDYGLHVKNVQCYLRYSNSFDLLEKGTFWTQVEFYTQEYLHSLVQSHSMRLELLDDQSHSLVYQITHE